MSKEALTAPIGRPGGQHCPEYGGLCLCNDCKAIGPLSRWPKSPFFVDGMQVKSSFLDSDPEKPLDFSSVPSKELFSSSEDAGGLFSSSKEAGGLFNSSTRQQSETRGAEDMPQVSLFKDHPLKPFGAPGVPSEELLSSMWEVGGLFGSSDAAIKQREAFNLRLKAHQVKPFGSPSVPDRGLFSEEARQQGESRGAADMPHTSLFKDYPTKPFGSPCVPSRGLFDSKEGAGGLFGSTAEAEQQREAKGAEDMPHTSLFKDCPMKPFGAPSLGTVPGKGLFDSKEGAGGLFGDGEEATQQRKARGAEAMPHTSLFKDNPMKPFGSPSVPDKGLFGSMAAGGLFCNSEEARQQREAFLKAHPEKPFGAPSVPDRGLFSSSEEARQQGESRGAADMPHMSLFKDYPTKPFGSPSVPDKGLFGSMAAGGLFGDSEEARQQREAFLKAHPVKPFDFASVASGGLFDSKQGAGGLFGDSEEARQQREEFLKRHPEKPFGAPFVPSGGLFDSKEGAGGLFGDSEEARLQREAFFNSAMARFERELEAIGKKAGEFWQQHADCIKEVVVYQPGTEDMQVTHLQT